MFVNNNNLHLKRCKPLSFSSISLPFPMIRSDFLLISPTCVISCRCSNGYYAVLDSIINWLSRPLKMFTKTVVSKPPKTTSDLTTVKRFKCSLIHNFLLQCQRKHTVLYKTKVWKTEIMQAMSKFPYHIQNQRQRVCEIFIFSSQCLLCSLT